MTSSAFGRWGVGGKKICIYKLGKKNKINIFFQNVNKYRRSYLDFIGLLEFAHALVFTFNLEPKKK